MLGVRSGPRILRGMGLRRWWRHLSAFAAANVRGDAASALRERRELTLLAIDGDADAVTFTRDGLTWTTAAVRHTITRNLFVHGRHPRDEVAALGAWLAAHGRLGDAHPFAVDVGANVGAPTLFFARDLGRRVIAVEPVPQTFALLRRNVETNGFGDRVTLVNAAIAETAGTVSMVRHAKDGWSEVAAPRAHGATQSIVDGTPGAGTVQVPARRLDDVVAAAGARPGDVSFVWSDTQGFEAQVIRSGTALWAAGTPAFVELWPEALARHGGVAAFAEACRAHFSGFVLRDDLVARGAAAEPRPVESMEAVLRSLRKQTDGLLVP